MIRNMTQVALAKKADASPTYVAHIEVGEISNTNIEHLSRIAGTLGGTLDELLHEYIYILNAPNAGLPLKQTILKAALQLDLDELEQYVAFVERFIRYYEQINNKDANE